MRWERVEWPQTKSIKAKGLTLGGGRDQTVVLRNACGICHISTRGISFSVKYLLVRAGCRRMVDAGACWRWSVEWAWRTTFCGVFTQRVCGSTPCRHFCNKWILGLYQDVVPHQKMVRKEGGKTVKKSQIWWGVWDGEGEKEARSECWGQTWSYEEVTKLAYYNFA